jgi:hypothetical protein
VPGPSHAPALLVKRLLTSAAEVGHGVCVNEHHANGYRLMPSPTLIAATTARPTVDAAIYADGEEPPV